MPHFQGDILVVTKEELIPDFWNTYNALKVQLHRHKNLSYGIKRHQVGGNGRQLLITFDSLPSHIREALGDPRLADHPLERFYQIDPEAYDYYYDFERPGYGHLKPEEAERYITNASVFTALVKLEAERRTEREIKRGSTKGVLKTIYNDSVTFQEILKGKYNSEHTLPSNERRFKQKYKEFKKNGFITLIKDPEGNAISNAKKVCESTIELLNNMFATQSHKPTTTEIFKQFTGFKSGTVELINNVTGEMYNPEDYKGLSESTVRSYLSQWENKVGNYATRSHDRQQFMTQFIPYDRMEQPVYSGSIISVDDRNPPFMYKDGKTGQRVWFYIAVDLASMAITAWTHAKSKADLMPEFYKDVVRSYHTWGTPLPHGLECESSLNSSYKESFLKNGAMFQDVRIEANSARSKRIENIFGQIRYHLEKAREGWIARPFAKSESNQQDQTAPKHYLTYEEIVENCLHDIQTWNNMEHNKQKGVSRWDYFMQNQHPELEATKYKNFLPTLGNHTETSCKAGIVKLQYGEYLLGRDGRISTGEDLISIMKQVEGKGFDVYWLDICNSSQGW